MARSRIYKFTVAENDQLVHEWIKLQNKSSFAITMAIHEYIEHHGMRDLMGANLPTPEQQNLMQMIYGQSQPQQVVQEQVVQESTVVVKPTPKQEVVHTQEHTKTLADHIMKVKNVEVSQSQVAVQQVEPQNNYSNNMSDKSRDAMIESLL